MRCRAAAAAVAAFLLSLIAPSAVAAPLFGFQDDPYAETDPAGYQADLQALNARVVRYFVEWDQIAPTKPASPTDPADPAYDWRRLDAIVRTAAGVGARVQLTLWHTPAWARLTARPAYRQATPRSVALAAFATATARRYSGTYPGADGQPLPRVVHWEAWNEPNQQGGLAPQRRHGRYVAARNYARMLDSVQRAIHAVAAAGGYQVIVAGGSLAPRAGRNGLAPITFLRRLARSHPRLDAVSVHPYPNLNRVPIARDSTAAPDVSMRNIDAFLGVVDELWPKRHLRIWVTEFGWQSKPDPFGATVENQARYLKTALLRAKKMRRLALFINFKMIDEPVAAGWQSGVRRTDLSPKPAYAMWQEVTAR